MRMWMINPKLLCRKHLLGEHVECHMLAGTLHKKKSVREYIEKGIIEIHNVKARHDELASEMKRRGYNYNDNKVLREFENRIEGKVDVVNSVNELFERCLECRKRITDFHLDDMRIFLGEQTILKFNIPYEDIKEFVTFELNNYEGENKFLEICN